MKVARRCSTVVHTADACFTRYRSHRRLVFHSLAFETLATIRGSGASIATVRAAAAARLHSCRSPSFAARLYSRCCLFSRHLCACCSHGKLLLGLQTKKTPSGPLGSVEIKVRLGSVEVFISSVQSILFNQVQLGSTNISLVQSLIWFLLLW